MNDDQGIGPWWMRDDTAGLIILIGAVLLGFIRWLSNKTNKGEG